MEKVITINTEMKHSLGEYLGKLLKPHMLLIYLMVIGCKNNLY